MATATNSLIETKYKIDKSSTIGLQPLTVWVEKSYVLILV